MVWPTPITSVSTPPIPGKLISAAGAATRAAGSTARRHRSSSAGAATSAIMTSGRWRRIWRPLRPTTCPRQTISSSDETGIVLARGEPWMATHQMNANTARLATTDAASTGHVRREITTSPARMARNGTA